jgi:predicted adenylyl cyclase CyaB
LKEFEVKIPVDNLKYVEDRLRRVGAVLVDVREEVDYYIDTKPCIDLVSNDSALRVRILKDSQVGGVLRGELTYKGPRENHSFAKVRKEVSVEVDNPLNLLEIFKALGFNVFVSVSKKRKIYQYKVYKVYLDDVEELGKFVEIEFTQEVGLGLEESAIDRGILELVEVLDLPKVFIKESYLELMLKKRRS